MKKLGGGKARRSEERRRMEDHKKMKEGETENKRVTIINDLKKTPNDTYGD